MNQELEDLFEVSVLPLKGHCCLRGKRDLLMSSGTHIFILCKRNQIPGVVTYRDVMRLEPSNTHEILCDYNIWNK